MNENSGSLRYQQFNIQAAVVDRNGSGTDRLTTSNIREDAANRIKM